MFSVIYAQGVGVMRMQIEEDALDLVLIRPTCSVFNLLTALPKCAFIVFLHDTKIQDRKMIGFSLVKILSWKMVSFRMWELH